MELIKWITQHYNILLNIKFKDALFILLVVYFNVVYFCFSPLLIKLNGLQNINQ